MAKNQPINEQAPIDPGQKPDLDTMGIDMPTLIEEFRNSRDYVEQFTRDFPQLDNLVDGVPIVKQDGAPYVGDTTLAGLVRSIPRASLKQLPVLSTTINGAKHSVPAFICNFLLKKKIFNEDTFGKGLLSTMQIGAEAALTHGYQPFMVATGQMYDDFGTTMRMIHYSDASLEPGVSDSNESGYHFVKAHLTKSRLKKILKSAKANKSTSWNVEALKRLLDLDPTSKNYTQYLSDPRKASGGQDQGKDYEIVTRYETEAEGEHVTFCELLPEAPLRKIKSKSKWGYPRVQYLVIDPAPIFPFGISRVRLASPNQNLMNIYLQNIASLLLINSAPPLLKIGTFLKPTPLKRNALWESVDPNASITMKNLDNGSLNQFVNFSNQFASQIQNIMGGQSTTVNAGSKGSVFGKTAPGVQAGQAFASLETNQITKILENFIRQYALVALDTLLSEQEGTDRVIVDDDTMLAINTLAEQEYAKNPPIDEVTGQPLPYVPTIGDDHKIEIKWADFYKAIEEMSVSVDISLSPDELKEREHADLQDTMIGLAQNADSIPGAAEKVQQITNLLLHDKAPLLDPITPTQVPATAPALPPEAMVPQV